jgi:hypothetical protein
MTTPKTNPPPAAAAKTAKPVSCPECGASITLRALGQSVMAACPACATQLDVSRPDIRIIEKYRETARNLRLPLGTRGTVKGQLFEVIGAMQRSVSGYRWQEYLLFNPYIGFRWLVNDGGHWNFGTMVRDTSAIAVAAIVSYQGRRYRKFQSGTPKVDWVIGEFYWRVAVGDIVKSSDYISPPFMLSLEKTKNEFTWSQLEYIEPEEIEEAFRIDSPARTSIAANQPNAAAIRLRQLKWVVLTALAAALFLQIGTAARTRSSNVLEGTYEIGNAGPEPHQQVLGPVELTASHSLNELTARASLNNSWVELDSSLVNTVTGESYDFTNAFSYYSGYDSDGSWSEGSNRDTSLVRGIPAGTYNLVVEGYSDGPKSVFLRLTHDVTPWQNFLFTALAILAYPMYLLFRRHKLERDRWSESDFDPYHRE